MKKNTCKVDMHVHSRHSSRPSSWILKKVGCSESYTRPVDLYHLLKGRGLDMVTLTDHNTIGGCLEIAHLPGTFISEEVTAYFPEDQCKIHVLVYDITEEQHDEISKIRKNVFELVDFLNAAGVFHAVAHPLFSVNGLLRVEHFHKLLLLFKCLELNGSRDSLQNRMVRRITDSLTGERLDSLADFYGIAPRMERPEEKFLIGGSDDHSSLYPGYSYTEVPEAATIADFLDGIGRGRARAHTRESGPETLAHNIYSIMYQFYNETIGLNRWVPDDDMLKLLEETLLPPDSPSTGRRPVTGFTGQPGTAPPLTGLPYHPRQFMENARKAIFTDDFLRHRKPAEPQEETWLRFVQSVSDIIMRDFADEILGKLTRADLFYLFTTLGSSASLFMMMSPYFIAYSLYARDRAFSLECLEKTPPPAERPPRRKRRIAMFTDTYNEINGVAVAVRSQVRAAGMTGKDLTLINCDPSQQPGPNLAPFTPIGEFEVPEYPELKIYCPPLLNILSYCYHQGFTHIHAETPGTMGLTAMAVANILNLPFSGTYHTSLPQTVGSLTGDPQVEDLFWKYITWFYGRMERIYAPSAMTAEELAGKGLPREKINVHQWGVDINRFQPGNRNGFFAKRCRIADDTLKLIYVGRVSREKNLRVLTPMMEKIRAARKDVALIMVGDGPYLAEMRQAAAGLPIYFTGYLGGDELAQAYASGDVFVFPSTIDTMGNVVVEAQASGVPVIVTDQGGPVENMIDGKTGFAVPADGGDLPDRLAEAVLRICEDPVRMKTMGEKAREYARTRSFENSFLDFWNHYENRRDNG